MIDRYTTPAMAAVWADTTRFGRWLEVELLATEFDRQRKATLKGHPEPEWVVVSPKGRYWQERNFSRAWEALRRRFGKKARPLPFHSTRHTFITWALEAGRHPKKVGEWAGVSEAVIYSNYSHVLPDQDDDMGFADVVRPGVNQNRTKPNQRLH